MKILIVTAHPELARIHAPNRENFFGVGAKIRTRGRAGQFIFDRIAAKFRALRRCPNLGRRGNARKMAVENRGGGRARPRPPGLVVRRARDFEKLVRAKFHRRIRIQISRRRTRQIAPRKKRPNFRDRRWTAHFLPSFSANFQINLGARTIRILRNPSSQF